LVLHQRFKTFNEWRLGYLERSAKICQYITKNISSKFTIQWFF